MKLRHGNRIRQSEGQVVRALQTAEAGEAADSGLSLMEIRQRAYEIYLSRNGAPGDAVADWLEAESELRAGMGRRRNE
jgi:hypothetical protein